MGERRMGVRTVFAALFLVGAMSGPARAATAGVQTTTGPSVEGSAGPLTFSLAGSIGTVGGTAYERLYWPDVREFKISELKWELKNLAAVGVQGAVGFKDTFGVFFGYRTVVNEGDGEMVDRDWLHPLAVTDDRWTDQSTHPDTTVDDGTMLDVGLTAGARLGGVRVSGIVGYRRDDWKWTARGGHFIYSIDGFRDTEFDVTDLVNPATGRPYPPDQPVITYEQEYTYPYVGLGLEGGTGAFGFSAKLLYSSWVEAKDTDYHVLRDTWFESDFKGGDFLGFGFAATYDFSRRFFAAFTFDYQKISEIRGDMLVRAPTPEESGTLPDGASVEIATTALSAVAGVRF